MTVRVVPVRGPGGLRSLIETRTGYLLLFYLDFTQKPELVLGLCSHHEHLCTVCVTGCKHFASCYWTRCVICCPVSGGGIFLWSLFKICTGVYMYVSVYICVWVLLQTGEILSETWYKTVAPQCQRDLWYVMLFMSLLFRIVYLLYSSSVNTLFDSGL